MFLFTKPSSVLAPTIIGLMLVVAVESHAGGHGNDDARFTCENFFLSEGGISDTILKYGGVMDAEDSIGDFYIWNNPATLQAKDDSLSLERAAAVDAGTKPLRIQGSCIRNQQRNEEDGDIVFGELNWNCNSQYNFDDGDSIFMTGGLPQSEQDTTIWGITGGTGKYANVFGESTVFFPQENNIAGLWVHDVVICTQQEYETKEEIALSEEGISDTVLYYNRTSGEDGIGDMYVWNNPATTSDGTKSLRIQGSCIRNQQNGTGAFAWNCVSQYNFNDGTIFLAGGLPQSENDSTIWGITGGNGKYSNVAGQSTVFFPQENNIAGLWQHDVTIIYNEGETISPGGNFALNEVGVSDTVLHRDGSSDGLGDFYIWNNAATKMAGGSGNKNLRIQGSCVRTQEGDSNEFVWNCVSQYNFAAQNSGSIFMAGGLPETEQDIAIWGITGGNGQYSQASGQSTVFFPTRDNIAGLWQHDLEICCELVEEPSMESDDGDGDGESDGVEEMSPDDSDDADEPSGARRPSTSQLLVVGLATVASLFC